MLESPLSAESDGVKTSFREMPSTPKVSPQTYYCRIRNCQRTCGLLHRDSSKKKYAFGQSVSLDRDESRKVTDSPNKIKIVLSKKKRTKKKVRNQRSTMGNSSSTSGTGSSGGESHITKESLSPQPVCSLDEIMETATKKISAVRLRDDSASLPLLAPVKSSERRRRIARLEPSVSLDTTTIHFDMPVWDNPELRKELLDSEEEYALEASPPSLREDSLVVDEIISEATHPKDYNPTDHDRKDEMISGWSSDENDYSSLDLTTTRPDSSEQLVIPIRKQRRKGVAYEQSLDLS